MGAHWNCPIEAVLVKTKLYILVQKKKKKIYIYTVEPVYLELAYFELPPISKWKSGPF